MSDFESLAEDLADEMPAMPMIAARVLDMMRRRGTGAEDLARVIAHDAVITAQILKMANSSYYSLSHRVRNIDHAVVILGEKTILGLVVAASLRGINQSFGLVEKMLWEDSIGCAIGARLIARRFACTEPEEAFLGGLLRHFGRIVMNAWNPEGYLRVMEGVYGGEGTLEEMERRFFPTSHAVIGAAVLRKWNFDENITRLVLNHEDFAALAEEEPPIRNRGATVSVAESFCRRLGIGQREPEPDLDIAASPGGRILGLEAEELMSALDEFQGVFEQSREAFLP